MDDVRIVADTNVLISGLLWTGTPHQIIKLAEDKHIILFSSLSIIEETSKVLAREKFTARIEQLNTTREELIEALLSIVEIVHPTEPVKAVSEDPEDDKILECAVAAQANYVVSGDPHLLRLKKFRGTKIVNPQDFIKDQ